MTIEQAQFIKDLRVNKGYSWRAVHIEWQYKYQPMSEWYKILPADPHHSNKLRPGARQSLGIELCVKAMHTLGESMEDGWN